MEAQRNKFPCPEKLDLVNKDGESGSKTKGRHLIENDEFVFQIDDRISVFHKIYRFGFCIDGDANCLLCEMFDGDVYHVIDFLAKNYFELSDLCPDSIDIGCGEYICLEVEEVKCLYSDEDEYCFHFDCTHSDELKNCRNYHHCGDYYEVELNYSYFFHNEENMKILETLINRYMDQN